MKGLRHGGASARGQAEFEDTLVEPVAAVVDYRLRHERNAVEGHGVAVGVGDVFNHQALGVFGEVAR